MHSSKQCSANSLPGGDPHLMPFGFLEGGSAPPVSCMDFLGGGIAPPASTPDVYLKWQLLGGQLLGGWSDPPMS